MSRCAGKPVPANAKLYATVKAAAKRRFKTYPSIYANSWLVAEYKRRGGTYRCAKGPSKGGLRKWYKEKWVDMSRPLKGGGWAQCGRPKVDSEHWREAYPKCRPLAEALKLTPAERRSAVRRKRAAVRKQRPGKPTYVKTKLTPNPAGVSLVCVAVIAAAAGALLWMRKRS